MKVYCSSSLWSKSEGILGIPQKVNLEFEHNGLKRIIPNIYHFSEGIVFDIITIVDEIEFSKFYEKYKDIEEDLTPLEQIIAEQENPYQTMDIKDIWINGIKAEEGHSSSGTFFTPWNEEQNELADVKEYYSSMLKGTTCFGCARYLVPYPKMDYLEEIKLCTYLIEKFYPLDIDFEMSVEDKLKEVSFIHPTTGIKHKLYFQYPEVIEIPKMYLLQSMYEIKPTLSTKEELQFGSRLECSEMSIKNIDSNSASCVGIIGGADGPSILLTLEKEKDIPYGQNGLPLHTSLSIPSLEKQDKYKFVLEGINIEVCDSEEYEL